MGSTQAWLERDTSSAVAALDDRTANLTRVPIHHNEAVQLLRYDVGQFYDAHNDWAFLPLVKDDKELFMQKHYGHRDRMATLFWYLNDVTDGGHTVFPKHGHPICPGIEDKCPGVVPVDFKRCDIGLKVQPKKGAVILWYNYIADGRGDHNALHGGCKPGDGMEKWSGNKWIHTKSLNLAKAQWMPDHPALKRFGFEEGPPMMAQQAPNRCVLAVKSLHAENLELFWVNPQDKQRHKMQDIAPGGISSMQSFKGHSFTVGATGKMSSEMVCSSDSSQFTVNPDLQIQQGISGPTEL